MVMGHSDLYLTRDRPRRTMTQRQGRMQSFNQVGGGYTFGEGNGVVGGILARREI